MDISIRKITNDNFNVNSLDNYTRRQEVRQIFVKRNNEYIIEDVSFVEDWSLERKRIEAKEIIEECVVSYAAFYCKEIVGFIALKTYDANRMILHTMQVDAKYRRLGIGKRLFEAGSIYASLNGAKELVISACNSVSTIAFYRSMGATINQNPINELVEEEPYDIQLVKTLEAPSFTKSESRDISVITRISRDAFNSDICVGGSEIGGPDGYDSIEFYRNMLNINKLFTLKVSGAIVGGAVIFKNEINLYVGRIFINPDFF